jgi:hypothetical protein
MTDRQHPRAIDVGGSPYLRDAKGALVPLSTVKATDLLMDEMVDRAITEATRLSAAIADFKRATFDAITSFQALVLQDYGAEIGGKKGNVTLTTFDGCRRVMLQVADLLEFGPELQAAKALIDECLSEWAAGSGAELRALVTRAFSVEKQGQINRTELFMLLRVEIADARWQRAMDAIRDSIRVIGSRSYLRFYQRDTPTAAWRAVSIDIAAV